MDVGPISRGGAARRAARTARDPRSKTMRPTPERFEHLQRIPFAVHHGFASEVNELAVQDPAGTRSAPELLIRPR